MHAIDLNCDVGEGIGNDEAIMPYISSANIACGYHAGDERTLWNTLELSQQHSVAVGAHVSFLDHINFGRVEMELSAIEVYELITQQLVILYEFADSFHINPVHVKPHGALYNMSARDGVLARTIAQAVKNFDSRLILFGLSGSHSITEAKELGLKTASEVFADRSYQEDGSLTPRSQPNALIDDSEKAVEQVLQMIKQGTVTTVSGKRVPIIAETICLHGDGDNAISLAKEIHNALLKENIQVRAIH